MVFKYFLVFSRPMNLQFLISHGFEKSFQTLNYSTKHYVALFNWWNEIKWLYLTERIWGELLVLKNGHLKEKVHWGLGRMSDWNFCSSFLGDSTQSWIIVVLETAKPLMDLHSGCFLCQAHRNGEASLVTRIL